MSDRRRFSASSFGDWIDLVLKVVSDSFEMSSGLGRTTRSLVSCIILAGCVFLVLKAFFAVGVWIILTVVWAVVALVIYRFRDRIVLSRLTDALRSDSPARDDRPRGAGPGTDHPR